MPNNTANLGPNSLGSTTELASVLDQLRQQDSTFAIPAEANFIVKIDNIPYATIKNVIDNHYDENSQWEDPRGLRNEIQNFITRDSRNTGRLLFATGVTIPGETLASGRVGPSTNTNIHGNLLSAPVIKGRNDIGNVALDIIETNYSFADYILRPWLIGVSTFGLFGRQTENQRVKVNLEVWHLDGFKSRADTTRKKITYTECAPISVPDFAYTYGENANVRVVKTAWTYKSYKITNSD